MPSVTVIVPIYNVAPYIERCARSIFEQTLENIEILFIDDCSPDNSVEIINRTLDKYPGRGSQTRIIKMQANSGSAGVRRQGMIEATGRYVIHLDGDDWVDADYYRCLFDTAINHDADIVIGDELMEYPDCTVPKDNSSIHDNGKEIMRNWYNDTLGLFCHNKLVRRELYTANNILPWPGLNMWEDNGLFARLFYHADKVVTVHGPVYHYNRCNTGAMTTTYGEKQIHQMLEIATHLADFFSAKPDASDYEKTVNAFKYLAKLNLITDTFSGYHRFKTIFPECDSIASELDCKAFSSRGRFRFHMVRLGLAPLFILMFKIYNSIKRN